MSINEKTKINVTVVSAILVICFLISGSYALGEKQAKTDEKIASNSQKIDSHLKASAHQNEADQKFKQDVSTRLTIIEEGVKHIQKTIEKKK